MRVRPIIFIRFLVIITCLKANIPEPLLKPGTQKLCPEIDPESNELTDEIKNFRLPKSIVPEIYDIEIKPNMTEIDSPNFDGNIIMQAKVVKNTKSIIFHQLDLDFESIKLEVNQKLVEKFSCKSYFTNDFIILNLDKELQIGDKIVIFVSYSGILLNRTKGIYKSTYTKPDGSHQQIISSQGEPTYSRRTFPNFDEPTMKAEHIISIWYPRNTENDFFALSNMPLLQTRISKEDPFYSIATFQKTPKMSSYLATFIVCDFAYIEDTSESGIPLRVYLTKHQNELNQAEWALKNLKNSFNFYEQDLFKIPYPLPKMDMIAIPNFASGAMENWGIVTYRETALLYNEGVSSVSDKKWVASVIAHELSHMWFGNLVTMSWWDDIWLNEGFATYFTFLGVDASIQRIYGAEEQASWDQITSITDDIVYSLAKDDLITGNPIIYAAKTKNEIPAVFNSIPYYKGASFIWSMVEVMGFDEFFNAVTGYLRENSFKNVNSDDLLMALKKGLGEDASDSEIENFGKFFNNYLKQQGYPLIKISEQNNSSFKVSQTQFFETTELAEKNTKNRFWTIPIFDQWMTKENNVLTVHPRPSLNTIFSNNMRIFARWEYPEKRNEAIIASLIEDLDQYDQVDRTQYIDDLFALTFSGNYEDFSLITKMYQYLTNERSTFVWSRVLAHTTRIIDSLDKSKLSGFADFILPYSNPMADHLGYNVEEGTYLEKKLRPSFIKFMVKLEDSKAEEFIVDEFKNWVESDFEVDLEADLRKLIYTSGMRFYSLNPSNDEKLTSTWTKVLKNMSTSLLAAETNKLLRCLCSVENEILLKDMINLAIYEKVPKSAAQQNFIPEIKQQDALWTLYYIAAYSDTGLIVVKNYLQNNFTDLVDKFGLDEKAITRVIGYIFSFFKSEEDLAWAVKFNEGQVQILDLSGKNTLEAGLDKIRANIFMGKRLEETFGGFLQK